jgi:hypothetical protein
MVNWDTAVGEKLLRRELHGRWGGGRYGGVEPSLKAESVFLFTNPKAGAAFGYNYDGWHADGTFHYTGDGQEATSCYGPAATSPSWMRRRLAVRCDYSGVKESRPPISVPSPWQTRTTTAQMHPTRTVSCAQCSCSGCLLSGRLPKSLSMSHPRTSRTQKSSLSRPTTSGPML